MPLFNSRGHPEAPSHIVARLKEIHHALGMVWVLSAERFALTYDWPDTDPRWKLVQAGELGSGTAYDIWGYAPVGMKDEDAYGWLVKTLERNGQSRSEAKALLDRVHKFNASVTQARDDAIVDDAEEYVRVHAPTIFEPIGKTIGRVYMSGRRSRSAQ